MASQDLTAQAAESNPPHDWQKERVQIITDVWKHILDPLVTFTEIIREHDQVENGVDFSAADVSAIMRLLLLGCYSETKFYASYGGSLPHFSADVLECALEDWNKLQGGKS